MKTVIKENTHLKRFHGFDFGWGNGYVVIPNEHPLYKKHYNEINVIAHGGLTFSAKITKKLIKSFKPSDLNEEDLGCWLIGFDTCHRGDNLFTWTKEDVEKEAKALAQRIIDKYEK